MSSHLSHGTKPGQRPSPGDPSLLAPSLPQEQGLKANNSKELSMCFTEVSEGLSGGECRGLGQSGLFSRSALDLKLPDSIAWTGLAELLAHLDLGRCSLCWG